MVCNFGNQIVDIGKISFLQETWANPGGSGRGLYIQYQPSGDGWAGNLSRTENRLATSDWGHFGFETTSHSRHLKLRTTPLTLARQPFAPALSAIRSEARMLARENPIANEQKQRRRGDCGRRERS